MGESDSDSDRAKSQLAKLLKGVASCPSNEVQAHLETWRDRLDEVWPAETSNDPFWSLLVSALPLPPNPDSSVDHKKFDLLLIGNPQSFRAIDAFLCNCAYSRLNQYRWTNHDTAVTYQLLAGCTNLAVIAKKFKLAEAEGPLFSALQSAVSAHWVALIWIAADLPQHIVKTRNGYRFAGVVDLISSQRGVQTGQLTRFLKLQAKNLDDRLFNLIEFLAGVDRTSVLRIVIPELIKEPDTRTLAKEFWAEDESISSQIGGAVRKTEWEADKTALLRIWPHYLIASDAFSFCWQVLFWRPRTDQFGDSFEKRIDVLRNLLTELPPIRRLDMEDHPQWKDSYHWRKWFLDFFKVVVGLVEGNRWNRSFEEAWIRQNEAVELVTAEQAHLKTVVWGILDEGKEHWDSLDPIILGLPTLPVIKCLAKYVNSHGDSSDELFHAKRLIAHLRGEIPARETTTGPTGLLGAVENLIRVSRTKMPDARARTWLGDAGIESLWLGAIQKGLTEFEAYLASQYGHDEHEHVAVLADKMTTHLNTTNATVSHWLRQKHSFPLFINASVRRFAKTSADDFPQEGGDSGVQADIGFLVDCDVPGMMKAKRITLVQAKKLKRIKNPDRWDAGFHFKGKGETQLKRLIERSQQAHYLFVIHPELGFPSMMLPATTVQNSFNASRSKQIGLPVVRNGGMPMSEFLLFGVIGLWTGDEDKNLIRECQRGSEIGQGPRIMIEVRISSEGQDHQIND